MNRSTNPDCPNYKNQLRKLHELLQLLHHYEGIVNNQKIVFFKPLPSGDQKNFFKEQTAVTRLVLGSNRSGKTACGAVESIAHMLGYRPWLPKDHPLRIVRLPSGDPIPVPNVGRIIAQNYEQAIQQTIMKKFDEWLPRVFLKKITKNTRGIPCAIELINGSVVYLMSNDQDNMAFEGPNGHWFWADEPIDNAKYTGLKRGLVDYNGHCWLTMTPLTQPWINDVIASKANVPGTGVKMFRFSIWDNCVDKGGYLSREAINSFLQDLREDEMEARLHGNFLHLAGLVYKEWRPEPPYWIDPFDIPPSWPRVVVTDPHPRKPIAMLWAAISPSNIWYIYRAIFDPSINTIKEAGERMAEAEGWVKTDDPVFGYMPTIESEPVALRIIDWSAQETERTSGTSTRSKFAELSPHLAHVLAKKHDAQYGYDWIHEQLKLKKEWDIPGIVVFNSCLPVKQNFTNFCFDDWATSKQRELKGDKEEYRKAHDDFIDAIRYLGQHRLTFHMLSNLWRKTVEGREKLAANPRSNRNKLVLVGRNMFNNSAKVAV